MYVIIIITPLPATSLSYSHHNLISEPVEATLPASVTNLAAGKAVFSSSQMNGATAQKATDGDYSTLIDDCYRPDSQDSSPYWLIDLQKSYNIVVVKLTNTGDPCCGRC